MHETKKTAKELQRQYLREWRRKNPDKVRKYNETYWERRLERENRQEARESND